MKVQIKITFQGETHTFNSEFDIEDEGWSSEAFETGYDLNTEKMIDTFLNEYEIEIIRPQFQVEYTKEDYEADRADNIRKYGKDA